MARALITRLFRFLIRTFYRRVEVLGLDSVPEPGPVIFAVNHPNGLVDPLFVLCFTPRPVSFLAKAPLWRYPLIGWFVRAMESIPVYRKQDHVTGSNEETFAKAREVLSRGGSIAIFPEGTTHSDPQLRELKTGAARIALGAQLEGLVIVPVGIYYTAKHIFRSSALVAFGDAIPVEPADSVDALTDRIDAGLDAVTLQADSHAALELIGRAEDIFTAEEDQPLAEELELRRRFTEGYHFLRERDPARLARLESSIKQFNAELGRARLEPHELVPRFEPMTLLRALVLLPLAILGAIIHYPVYRLIGALANRFSKGEREVVATMKVVAALLLYPLTWLAIAAVLAFRSGAVIGVAALVIVPMLGFIALREFEDLDDLIGRLRALTLSRRAYHRLRAERAELRREMIKVAEEMDGSPVTARVS
ncbi:MAG TPA: lysophospholipid acyltransferase family protein [Thermoanaerobaculia bacterium]|nr:lysophospholipid acyltransferase family protein [Thermoanaerobaculia bacterium]